MTSGMWKSFYSTAGAGLGHQAFEAELAAFIHGLGAAPPGDVDVIDVGAAPGDLAASLSQRGFSVVALDPDPLGARLLQERFETRMNVEVVQGAVSDYRQKGGRARGLCAVRSINHGSYASVLSSFAALAELLVPGGLMLLYTVASQDFRRVRGKRIGPFTYAPLDGPEAGIPHVFLTSRHLRLLLWRFEILTARRTWKPVPSESAYFAKYSPAERQLMREHNLASSHHVILARRR